MCRAALATVELRAVLIRFLTASLKSLVSACHPGAPVTAIRHLIVCQAVNHRLCLGRNERELRDFPHTFTSTCIDPTVSTENKKMRRVTDAWDQGSMMIVLSHWLAQQATSALTGWSGLLHPRDCMLLELGRCHKSIHANHAYVALKPWAGILSGECRDAGRHQLRSSRHSRSMQTIIEFFEAKISSC